MWMVSNLFNSTIIFIGGQVPDDCLNTDVSVAVISDSGSKKMTKTDIRLFLSHGWGTQEICFCFSL